MTSFKSVPALKLMALDEEDLEVLSAHLQDALVRVEHIAYLPHQKRFALILARHDWNDVSARPDPPAHERSQCGLHFDHVQKVETLHIDRAAPEVMLNLLAIRFTPSDLPSGVLILTFSGGKAIRLHVEAIEAQLRDLGMRWWVRCKPDHEASPQN